MVELTVIDTKGEGSARGRGRAPPETDPRDETDDTRGRLRLVCRGCEQVLAQHALRVAISGAEEHTFFNPAGIAYRVTCYRSAEGAARVGSPEAFFSWFPGYAWTVLHCGACAAHVGWSFDAEDGAFVALVTHRVREVDSET